MSESGDERRRIASVRAAQRTAAAHRYRLETRSVSDEPIEAPPGPEREFDPGRLERSEPPDAPPVSHALLRSSLRQAMAGESWESRPTIAAPPERETAPMRAPPPRAAAPTTMSSEAAAAFDAGLQQMASPPARPAVCGDESSREEAPISVWGGPVDNGGRLEQGLQSALAQPPAVPMPMPMPMQHEVAAAFEAGARDMASCPQRQLPTQTVQRPQTPHAEEPTAEAPRNENLTPMPMTNEVTTAFDTGAREMAAPQARPSTMPLLVQVDAPEQAPSRLEPAPPRPQQRAMPKTLSRDTAMAFDAGVRDMAPAWPRPATPPPRSDVPFDESTEERIDQPEQHRDDGDDPLRPAQQALDARLAQLTFNGIVTHGGG
jgi:hypothetical protein